MDAEGFVGLRTASLNKMGAPPAQDTPSFPGGPKPGGNRSERRREAEMKTERNKEINRIE